MYSYLFLYKEVTRFGVGGRGLAKSLETGQVEAHMETRLFTEYLC